MELRFYMRFVTPPIHFGRVILNVWISPFLVSLLRPFTGLFLVFCAMCVLGGTYVSCVSPNASLLIQHVL